ncbi:hypothetical protein [uncultured Legionella sp.]|uniref:hypothetical protein n=1 Tax=uncultured Legionella sp. TaxID=210934 RepID=UPI00261C1D9F|nr:hypothetical protein [uncultured Legionella sp.]
MRVLPFKKIFIAFTVLFFSLTSYADEPASGANAFLSACTNSWMSKADKAADKVDYKNFGEKYCTCASQQPLDNDAAIKKAIQLCMSRTLLHDAMGSLEEEVGLSDAKDTDLIEYCQDRWNLIYPQQTDDVKKLTTAYCECAKPKLLDLIKQSDSMTDKQYDDSINTIALDCSGNVNEEQPAPSTASPAPAN